MYIWKYLNKFNWKWSRLDSQRVHFWANLLLKEMEGDLLSNLTPEIMPSLSVVRGRPSKFPWTAKLREFSSTSPAGWKYLIMGHNSNAIKIFRGKRLHYAGSQSLSQCLKSHAWKRDYRLNEDQDSSGFKAQLSPQCFSRLREPKRSQWWQEQLL